MQVLGNCHGTKSSKIAMDAGSGLAIVTIEMQVSLWMQRWQNRLSTWLHVSLSQQILRLYRPAGILSAGL